MRETYIQYGVASDLAEKLSHLGLPKSTFDKTSTKNLCERYGLDSEEVKLVKELIKRHPIDENTIEHLLESANYVCCVCKGTKGSSYIIHHMEEYSISQNNEYYNLAVLCPTCHDTAHKNGKSLSLKLTEDQIYKSKEKWEKEVERLNVEKASKNGNIFEVDFLNVPRILELSRELFSEIPTTSYTEDLIKQNLIDIDSNLNSQKIADLARNPNTPLIFFAAWGSSMLKFHYFDIFKRILSHLEFKDLDLLLTKTSIKSGIVGEYCYYVGGLYSSTLPGDINGETVFMKFHIRKKQFIVEWLVDPKYFGSSSAKWRTAQRNVYMIYGKVRNVNIEVVDDKKKIIVDIRPYCFGLPEKRIDRKPIIAYLKEVDEVFEDDETDEE
ncbi:HNH endonuclease [Mangrovibacterium sp.]|uniref:HNH endonuclease n=1 Tax=Mangrovibacterium sp. TaxID=1961364 RepID=UPI003562508C